MKKIARSPGLVFFFIFMILYFLIEFLFKLDNPLLRTCFSATLAFVLSPRKKKIQTQTGEKTQITWFFLKEPIIID